MAMTFTKAERRQHKPKLALTGPSGSGKTFSALLIASGMGKRIAVIDTENGSASLYANMDKGPLRGVSFDVLEIDPPYTIQKYAEAIALAQSAKYDVLVIDSISHAWAGEGGLLAKKEALDSRGGNQNSYTNWASITKEHETFKARILAADVILICTMRSKQDYVLETNEKGKQAPKKVGMAPIQRDGMEYEFTTVFDLAMDHNAAASKDRTFMFDGQIFKPTKKTGEEIMTWLKGGKAVDAKIAEVSERQAEAQKLINGRSEFGQPDDAPADEPEIILASKDQQSKISAGIAAMNKLGFSPATIWNGIGKEVVKYHERVIVDTQGISNLEAETIIDYLGRWAKYVKDARASAAAKHTAEDHAGLES
jgi:hypothetical protein